MFGRSCGKPEKIFCAIAGWLLTAAIYQGFSTPQILCLRFHLTLIACVDPRQKRNLALDAWLRG